MVRTSPAAGSQEHGPNRLLPAREPLLLAIETATSGASLALLRGERLLGELSLAAERGLAEQVLPALEALLSLARFGVTEIERFAVSIGPGSFTGLRVGVATVQGLAFGSPACAVAVPTLSALARGALPSRGPVAAVLDARRDEVYAAVFEDPERVLETPLVPEAVYGIDALAARLPENCVLVGEGALLHRSRLLAMRADLHFCDLGRAGARAVDVGVLGSRLIGCGLAAEPAAISPRYLRRAEAEARRTGEALERG